jgi:hypothetical protein
MGQFHYDKLIDFGKLTAAGMFPNIIDLGEAGIGGMTVDLKLPSGSLASGGPVTLSILGSDAEAGTYAAVVTGGPVSRARLEGEGYGLPVPKGHPRFLKATLAGTFTGTVQAIINPYLGK